MTRALHEQYELTTVLVDASEQMRAHALRYIPEELRTQDRTRILTPRERDLRDSPLTIMMRITAMRTP